MNEQQARQVLLLQAFESMPDGHPQWTADDRRWATRAAQQSLGDEAPRERFVVERARLAMQRLAPRDETVRRVVSRPTSGASAAGIALLAGALLGLLSDTLVAGDYFNLLSPLFWGLLAWNLAVYLWLAVSLLRGGGPGPLRRMIGAALQRWARRAGRDSVLAGFGARWAGVAAPLNASRAALLLHLAAAGSGIGLVGGLLLRGLVLDYRAGWATTLLDSSTVHAALAAALAPAFALLSTLAGAAPPDAAGFAALRVTPMQAASASAAPWLLWMAAQIVLVVVLPRLALAGYAALRASWQARHLPLDLSTPYFERLQQAAVPRAAWVLPHAAPPEPQAVLGLQGLLAGAWGESLPLQVAPVLAYGDEESPPAPPAGARAIVLVDLAATPEPDVHARLLTALRRAAPTAAPLLLADEGGFVRRFGRGARLDERRGAWRALARDAGAGFASVDLAGPEAAAEPARLALREALEAPA
jgi:hypothetical protein